MIYKYGLLVVFTKGESMIYYLYFDGGSRGNPGISGSGAVIFNSDMKEIASTTYECGIDKTNNHAEYMGLFKGIEMLYSNNIKLRDVIVRGDSMLVVKQCKGEWKVREQGLIKIFTSLFVYLQTTEGVCYEKIVDYFNDVQHVPRKENKRADELSNIAMNNLKLKI
jgi:ribonuclease HI